MPTLNMAIALTVLASSVTPGADLVERELEHQLDVLEASVISPKVTPSPHLHKWSKGGGRVFGEVRDRDGLKPLAAAQVSLRPFGSSIYAQRTQTDAMGRFAFENLAPGYYYIEANGVVGNGTVADYQPLIYPDIPCELNCRNVFQGRMLRIGLGDDPGQLNVVLDRGASVSGRLTATGQGRMRSAVIAIYNQDKQAVAAGYAVTEFGSDGSTLDYRVGGLPAGDYFLAVRARAMGSSNDVFTARSLSGESCGLGNCMQAADGFSLAEGQQLSGIDLQVSGQSGAWPRLNLGFPDASMQIDDVLSVDLYSTDGTLVGWVHPSDMTQGNPRARGFSPPYVFRTVGLDFRAVVPTAIRFADGSERSYRARVLPFNDCSEQDCDPTLGQTPDGQTIYRLTPAGSLSGSVFDYRLRAPLPGVRVVAFDSTGRRIAESGSGIDGSFRIMGLADGVYHLATDNDYGFVDVAWPNAVCTGDCSADDGDGIAVNNAQDMTGLSLRLNGPFFGDSFEGPASP